MPGHPAGTNYGAGYTRSKGFEERESRRWRELNERLRIAKEEKDAMKGEKEALEATLAQELGEKEALKGEKEALEASVALKHQELTNALKAHFCLV